MIFFFKKYFEIFEYENFQIYTKIERLVIMNLYVPSLSCNSYQHTATLLSATIPTPPLLRSGQSYFKAIPNILTIPIRMFRKATNTDLQAVEVVGGLSRLLASPSVETGDLEP